MPDNILDLGTTTLWRPSVNWREKPKNSFNHSRQLIGYSGTVKQIFLFSAERPQIVEFKISLKSKAEEKALIQQFIALKGRFKRFWLLMPNNLFTLHTQANTSATSIFVKSNKFDYRGFERFYILLANGDLITRKITNYGDNGDNTETMHFSGGLDRTITAPDIERFGLVLLVRLDLDEIAIDYETTTYGELSLRVFELVKEYSLA